MLRRVNIPRSGADDIAALIPGEITLSVGAEVAHPTHGITTTVQLYDCAGNLPREEVAVECWLSDAAKGALCAAAPTSGGVGATGTSIAILTAAKHFIALTNAAGALTFGIINTTGAKTVYLNIAWGGVVRCSAAITFSA